MMRNPFKRKIDLTRYDSLIGASVQIEGTIRYTNSLRIDGYVSGEIVINTNTDEKPGMNVLIVGKEGCVNTSMITADHLIVNGLVRPAGPSNAGTLRIKVEHLKVESKGRIFAELIEYKTIELTDGAVVNGRLVRLDDLNPSSFPGTPEFKAPTEITT